MGKYQDWIEEISGRVEEIRNIKQLVSWLPAHASRFITDQEFIVDGGMTRKMIYEEQSELRFPRY
ncbi:MAG: hypothetical protein EOP04_21275 [Proteobacteria bacterium]|nr:MAG: hypothetical protein EOP04_21275 [Pseudomonadota bacterium]